MAQKHRLSIFPNYIFNPGSSIVKFYSNRTKTVINEDLFTRNVR